MGKIVYFGFTAVLIFAMIGLVTADRLPNQTPENQIFSIDTVIDVTGAIDDKSTMSWVIASPGAIPTGILGSSQVISDVTYKDAILTNGGKLAENKNFDFSSKDQSTGLYNVESQKVLTYASTEGAHMVGEEEYTLSVAGNYVSAEDQIRCVFSTNQGRVLPAFCNIVSAKSALVNVNSAQVSTKGQIRAVASSADTPAELNYQLAVTPDANSGSGFAEGTVKTTFAGSIMEARDGGDGNYYRDGAGSTSADDPYATATWNKTSVTNTWKDSTEVTGGIRNLQKAFGYQSGFFGASAPASPARTVPSVT
ncbi:hypothetical protein [Methanospirillum lacunae]|uniref:Uncharacterized protein n=1 Tax=Methanospirillum lacunae TaxID=668570 RepID=A0A2V2MX31_9EURY|nr:hypothetical protein [Methanospirillum lacunae]PWR72714.1 hypothetical protein DK846_07110 [Methanospirillum lacunae]